MPMLSIDRSDAVAFLDGRSPATELLEHARRLRDARHGRTVTYSRKVFIPVTTLCRDTCSYCTFVKPPGAGGEFLTPDDVLAIASAGAKAGCTEALLTLGDRPEDKWPQARAFLRSHGYDSTIEYVVAMSELIRRETGLFPHANPGVMAESDIASLRPTNVSMGLMLENVSDRLTEPGMPHHACPDKVPAVRMATIRAAGRRRVPFTTGILVGIGETAGEIVDSIAAIADLQSEHGHIQEVIVQNFRAKANTRMRGADEPGVPFIVRVVALARVMLGSDINLQVPPNLTEDFGVYLRAGINDWGGVSPVTIDYVNPEAPWPHLERLAAITEAEGFSLRPRMPVYPEYISEKWIDPGLFPDLVEHCTPDGYAVAPQERTP